MGNITVPGLPSKTGEILDSAYLHLNESSIDKKITIAQLLEKIEAQYSADIVTFLGSANKAEGRANLSIDRRVTVDNANYTILATDKVVAQIGTMSAARTFSLPAASTVQAGAEIIIIDESGSVDSTNKIIVQRNGTDTIDGLTQLEIAESYGSLKLICNGTDKWKILIVNASFPTFKATMSAPQNIGTGVTTKIAFDTEEWDSNSNYDTSNYRFTPQKAGIYAVSVSGDFVDAGASAQGASIEIRKNNNTISIAASRYYDNGSEALNTFILIEMDGSTDYLEAFGYINGIGANTIFNGAGSNFQAFRITSL